MGAGVRCHRTRRELRSARWKHYRSEALETELSGKRLELLKEAFPKLARVAVLWNAADFGMTLKFREIELAAQALRVAVQASAVREPKISTVSFRR